MLHEFDEETQDAIRKSLQMGADKGVHVLDDAVAGSDAMVTSRDFATGACTAVGGALCRRGKARTCALEAIEVALRTL